LDLVIWYAYMAFVLIPPSSGTV